MESVGRLRRVRRVVWCCVVESIEKPPYSSIILD